MLIMEPKHVTYTAVFISDVLTFSSISIRFFINLQDLIKFHENYPTIMADNMSPIQHYCTEPLDIFN